MRASVKYLLFTALTAAASCSEGGNMSSSSGNGLLPTRAAAQSRNSARATAEPEAPSFNTVAPEALIVAGYGIGGTRLGEPYDSIAARLGRPDESDAAMQKMMATWHAGHKPGGHQTSIFFSRDLANDDETSRARQIRITSPYFKTTEGIGVGANLSDLTHQYRLRLLSAYREGGERYRIYSNPTGIVFEVNRKEECTAVIVQDARAGSSPYLPFHPNATPME